MTAYQTLIDKIHLGVNPYDGYQGVEYPASPYFVMVSPHADFKGMIARTRPHLIIEVGSFLGGSATRMAEALKETGLTSSAILCVDTWLAEQVLWSTPAERPRLQIKFGRPNFYYTFLSNIVHAKAQDVVVPLSMPSLSAGRYIKQLGLRAQMIFIDGCHEKGDVRNDLEMYWEILDPGGEMLIDDYAPWAAMYAGLVEDVNAFCQQHRLAPKITGNCVLLHK